MAMGRNGDRMGPAVKLRIALIDEILEHRVISSLELALIRAGHTVLRTGKLTHGMGPAERPVDIARLAASRLNIDAFEPDAVILFRPQSWPVEYAAALRRRGVKVLPWLSDGPVLYQRGYSRILEEADLILHCGHQEVIDFFEKKGMAPEGVNFPFWSEHPSQLWSQGAVSVKAPVFLGNLHDDVRRVRIDTLEKIESTPYCFGKIRSEDRDRVRWGGVIDSDLDIAGLVMRHRLALNFPQQYRNYVGSDLYFPELPSMQGFQTPSRLVQYAAMGIPTLTLGFPGLGDGGLQGQIVANSEVEFVEKANSLGDEELRFSGTRMQEDYKLHFTPETRVAFLEYLLHNDGWRKMDSRSRSELYRSFSNEVGRASTVRSAVQKVARGIPRSLDSVHSLFRKGRPIVVLFSAEWLRPSTETQEMRTKLRQQGFEVLEMGPQKLNIQQDPRGDFKGLIDESILTTVSANKIRALVVMGSQYGLCRSLWEELKLREILVICPADDCGFSSMKRNRLAARADYSASMQIGVVEQMRLLGLPNHGMAPLESGVAEAYRGTALEKPAGDELEMGHEAVLRLYPNSPLESEVLEGATVLRGYRMLVLDQAFQELPVRSRVLFRLAAQSRVVMVVPRGLFELLDIQPTTGVLGYADEAELERHIEQVLNQLVGPPSWTPRTESPLQTSFMGKY